MAKKRRHAMGFGDKYRVTNWLADNAETLTGRTSVAVASMVQRELGVTVTGPMVTRMIAEAELPVELRSRGGNAADGAVTALEAQVATLRQEVTALKQEVTAPKQAVARHRDRSWPPR